MTHVVDQFETRLERQSPAVIRRWWIFVFVSFCLVFLSTLFFLGEDAYAKSGGEGGGSGGGGPTGGLTSGGVGDGDSGKGGGGGDSAKGGGQQQPALGGGDRPTNNIASGNGNPSKKDVSGEASGPLGDAAKNDAKPSSPEGAPTSPTATETNEKNFEPVLGTVGPAIEEASKAVKPVAESAKPLMEQASPLLKPAIEEATKTAKPVTDSVATSAEPLVEKASPLVKPVKEVTDPVVAPIRDTVAPISEAAKPVLDPVTKEASEVLEPTLAPVREAVAPVVGPVGEQIGEVAEPVSEIAGLPVVGPLSEPTSPALLDPLGSQLEPVSAPVAVAPPTTVAPTMVGGAGQMFEPVPAEGIVPFLGSDGQPSWSQPGGESLAYYPTALPEPAMAAAASTSLDSGAVWIAQEEGNLQGSASTNATANLSGSHLERQLGHSLFEEGLASLGLLAGMNGAQNQTPQPSSPAGGMPAAAGGFSGGSSSSPSGGGIETGILGLLAALLLGGKFLWTTRDFLKPNAALLLAIERPG